MLKTKKFLSLFFVALLLMSSFSITASASDDYEIMPLYSYTHNASSNIALSNGTATASVHCTGYSGLTKKITAKTCIQKKLGLIWIKIDIGTSDDYWYDTANNYYLITSHSKKLSSYGTYRAKTEYTVTGNDGKTEEMTVTSSAIEYR